MHDKEVFANVLLPLPVPRLFTYRIPAELAGEAVPGKRVIVPFGKQKVYSGVIREIYESFPDPSSLKEVLSILDDLPLVNEKQFALWDWMSEYYMCSTGEVMNCALPAALKLQSETIVEPTEIDPTTIEITEAEEQLYRLLLEKKSMTIGEVSEEMQRPNVHPMLKRAFEKGLIILSEEIQEQYKPKKEKVIRFAEAYKSESALSQLFSELESDPRKVRQVETLMVFLKYLFEKEERDTVNKSLLLKHKSISRSSLQTLIHNGILVESEITVDRIPLQKGQITSPVVLSDIQKEVLEKINSGFEKHDVILLHGVTSSGKTELYIHLIEETIKQGKQVLYLLPEIALTTQIINRLRKHFGDRVGVYHSRYSGNERVEIWNHVLSFNTSESNFSNRSQIILGARSCLFLPFKDLGLVIVDEEHDSAFKQNDPAPRYNGRDTAIVLAKLHQAKTILGSATPSIETYYNATNDRYGLVNLSERHGGLAMPEVVVADMKEARKRKQMKSIFTPQLLFAIETALAEKEQVILFQNRRGFSPFIECKNCDWIPHCKNCSVTLTYHKHNHSLRCHYCGYIETIPSVCPVCHDHQIEVKGFGTEKVEEEIAVFFPNAAVARMDFDSTRTKTSYQRIINDFEEQRIDILVGTQMVTKGLDFDHVSTVGILNADQLLNFPDFRSHERGFQLMAQVSGRSGRKVKRGKVIIQTVQADHAVIAEVVRHDYPSFYRIELAERKAYNYPPFSRLIELTIRHRDELTVHQGAIVLTDLIREKMGGRVLGPNIPLVPKIRNQFNRTILIKIERKASVSEAKKVIKACVNNFIQNRDHSAFRVIVDVDPS